MLTEEEYKKEWLNGLHKSDYNNCRFSDDKVVFAKQWLLEKNPKLNFDKPQNIIDLIASEKLRIITDEQYCKLCQSWADKAEAQLLLNKNGYSDYIIPTEIIEPDNNKITVDMIKDAISKIGSPVVYLKCNHGSGWNLKVDKTNNPNLTYLATMLNQWCFLNYAYISGYEKQYENIKPKILVQPELIDKPLDYGFWCIDGNIEGISITKKYGKNFEEYFAFVNENGNANDWYIGMKPEWENLPGSFKTRVNVMIPFVKDIAKQFKFVRLDMYFVNNKPYFGETTFTPCSGILELNYR